MSSTLLESGSEQDQEEQLGSQMSFLDHLEELRKRIIRSAVFIFVAFIVCFQLSEHIYNFLAIPVERALAEAERRQLPFGGRTGSEIMLSLSTLKEGDAGRYVFSQTTTLGTSVIPLGTTVQTVVAKDTAGLIGLFTDEPLFTANAVIPKGVRVPIDFSVAPNSSQGRGPKLIFTTVTGPFSLYMKVSLYAAICLSVPFLLWQIWAFVAPGLYPHERGYAIPFIGLSTISFVIGAALAYYVLFPRAAAYLLGIGQNFQALINANDYFDFIILVMLAMGIVFQMPAITYVLARIGLVTAGLLIRTWKIALIAILIAAALLSPTSDVLNMTLFAIPMAGLYLISILIAWIFNKPRTTE